MKILLLSAIKPVRTAVNPDLRVVCPAAGRVSGGYADQHISVALKGVKANSQSKAAA